MKIVSACLAGINCNYKGQSNPSQKVIELVKGGKAIPLCPEQLGGLSSPRVPAELLSSKIVTKTGDDITGQFKKGAEEALKIAKLVNCKEAILKSNSPSCGSGKIYDGSFTGTLVNGDGIFTKLLKKNKIAVYNENSW